jgi:hypothetical protein
MLIRVDGADGLAIDAWLVLCVVGYNIPMYLYNRPYFILRAQRYALDFIMTLVCSLMNGTTRSGGHNIRATPPRIMLMACVRL